MEKLAVQSIFPCQCGLAASPFWDFLHAKLYWLDREQGELFWFQTGSGDFKKMKLLTEPKFVLPTKTRGLIVATPEGLTQVDSLDDESSTKTVLVSDSEFQHGVCGSQRRIWLTRRSETEQIGETTLCRVDPDGQLHQIQSTITADCGFCWNLDGSTLYGIDSQNQSVVAYEYSADSDTLSNHRTLIHIPLDYGRPVGLTLDRREQIWVSTWDGGAIYCYDPVSNTLSAKIELPVSKVTACCFGGANFDKLYITTARQGLGEAELEDQPLAGNIFLARPEVAGMPTSYF